jgi:hypothetical protein
MSHAELLSLLAALISPEEYPQVMEDIQNNVTGETAKACYRVLEAAFGNTGGCMIGETKVLFEPHRREEVEWMSKEINNQVSSIENVQFAFCFFSTARCHCVKKKKFCIHGWNSLDVKIIIIIIIFRSSSFNRS